MDTTIALTTGLFLSLVLGTLATYYSINFMDKEIEKLSMTYAENKESERSFEKRKLSKKLSIILGIIERTIYYFSALISAYTLVAGWLVLKSVSSLISEHERKQKWETYKIYLIGVGMSLIFGLGGGIVTRIMLGLKAIPENLSSL